MNPMVKKGYNRNLNEMGADDYFRHSFDSEYLSTELDMKMKEIKQSITKKKENSNILISALWKIHYKQAFLIALMTTFLAGIRFGTALFFEQLLQWFEDDDISNSQGWLWGTLFVLNTFIGNFVSTQLYLIGSMIGLKIKLAILGMTHKKILKLNTSIISWQTTGQIVNFASNDLKYFDEGINIAPYLILGPIELIGSFVLFGIRIGWIASLLGLSVMILYIPVQAVFVKRTRKFERKALTLADERINASSEMITGILAVKSFTWENSIFSKIKFLRLKEHKQLFKITIISALTFGTYNFVTGFIPFATFTTVILSGREFDVSSAFFILAIINITRVSVTLFFPLNILMLSQASISMKRLNDFLILKEPKSLQEKDDMLEPRGTIDAKIENFGWLMRIKEKEDLKSSDPKRPLLLLRSKDRTFSKKEKSMLKEEKKLKELKSIKSLHDISFKIKSGELIGIVGEVGSGKSSLLSALLGEMQDLSQGNDITFANKTKVHKQVHGIVSYCAQSPWILSGTVKENILFGSEFDQEWYNQVIKSCSLDIDLEQFPAGDMTELGERGINLSGGQKARMSLARAAYKKADVNLLDDPLSAVDPKVANILFDSCISNDGLMNGKTRLLVSHQVQFMCKCDRIIIMDSGKIVAMDRYEHLIESEYSQIFMKLEKSKNSKLHVDDKDKAFSSNSSNENNHILKSENVNSDAIPIEKEEDTDRTRSGKLVDKEEKVSGSVSWHVYWSFFKYMGFFKFCLSMITLLISISLLFISQFWIYEWASQGSSSKQDDWQWIMGLGIICILLFLFSMSYTILFQGCTLVSLTKIHLEMIKSVLFAPLSFFHTNPTGRIINRFSKDQSMADCILHTSLDEFTEMFIKTFGFIIVICIALPYTIILFPFYLYIVCKFSDKFLKSSREIRRYDGITRSPIYEKISENLKGLATIKAYGMQKKFNSNFMSVLNRNGTWWMCYQRLLRWFGIRLDLMSSLVILVCTFVSIAIKEHVNTEFVSVAFLNVMYMAFILQYVVKQYGSVENSMTGVERMLEYTKLEKEAPTIENGGNPGPEGWPQKGFIVFNNVSSRYRKELEPVLNNLTFEIPAGISVGIIGRTGSGKSSFLLTLYRLIEKIEGNIYLDGIDIDSIGLDVLRKNMAIIPQDPILFEGSLRFNLDSWNQFSDEKLWEILDVVQLKDVIMACGGGLDTQLSEGGSNFSVGQRQLLCLARALLKDAKVLSVDEATANVDNLTDNLVQSSIREFVSKKNENGEKYRTLFVIAHRLNTILDCDLLMVFDNGNIVEMGSPAELKMKADSVFSSMLNATNDMSDN